jgi:septal ring factor EnvC (AmiA/AmiB activator)
MRRGSRIAASVAAAGALITGAGVALGGVPDSPATHTTASEEQPRVGQSQSTVELDRLAGQRLSDEKRAEALSRAIGRARKRLAAEQRKISAEQAAQARARRAAAQAAATQAAAAQAAAAQQAQAAAVSYQPAAAPAPKPAPAQHRTPPAPVPTRTHQAPPPTVTTTTGASGSHPSGEPSEPGEGNDD